MSPVAAVSNNTASVQAAPLTKEQARKKIETIGNRMVVANIVTVGGLILTSATGPVAIGVGIVLLTADAIAARKVRVLDHTALISKDIADRKEQKRIEMWGK